MKKLTVLLLMAVLIAACGSEPAAEPEKEAVDTKVATNTGEVDQESGNASAEESQSKTSSTAIDRFREAIEGHEFFPDGGKVPLDISVEDRELSELRDNYTGLTHKAIVKNRSQIDDQDEFLIFEFDTPENAKAYYNEYKDSAKEMKLNLNFFINDRLVIRVLNQDSEHLDEYKQILENLTP